MNYDAINISSYDLAGGLPFLQELFFLPLVSANFYDDSDQPLFQPYIIKSINDLKIGVIGLSAEFNHHVDGVYYRPWQEVLPTLLDDLVDKTDVIIVLSALKMNENNSIALSFPSVQILFTAVPGNRSVPIKKEQKTLLAQTMDRGRYLGYLFLQNPEQENWQDRLAVAKDDKRQRSLRYRLQRIEMILQKRPNMAESERNRLNGEKAELAAQLNDDHQQPEPNMASYLYRNIPILPSITPNKEIERLVEYTKMKMESGTNPQ